MGEGSAPAPWRTQATVFLSAFLLFFVQPLMGKVLLPWFGGVPAVWTTCLLFFQGVLLVGYLWGHLLVLRLAPRPQARLQVVLWAAAGLALVGATAWWGTPLVPAATLKPDAASSPLAWLLMLLSLAVGLPYFALSTTSPVMQAWHARVGSPASAYRLAAVSNLGSMLGLLAYPFLVEPFFGTRAQAWGWALGFFGFVALAASTARQAVAAEVLEVAKALNPLRPGQLVEWATLAATSSALLMAFTNHLTQEVAPIPFLWVAPLAVYLLSFIACFESDRWYTARRFLTLALQLTVAVAFVLSRDGAMPLMLSVPLYLTLLFSWCMVAHGELFRSRPEASHLTAFTLMVSLGGALGAAAVTVLAPQVLKSYAELQLSLIFAVVVAGVVLWRDPGSLIHGAQRRLWRAGLGGLAVVVVVGLLTSLEVRRVGLLEARRDFFGVVRVVRVSGDELGDDGVLLMHGRTVHGAQRTVAEHRREPTAYYSEHSGVGLLLQDARERLGRPLVVGAIGLGVGTVATYGRAGDRFRFYELSPAVAALAQGEGGYFSFLSGCPATVTVVLGDARLSLEREAPQGFDALVLDAFSSDAVPAHLLTREAFSLYLSHLNEDGVVAVHLSNRSLDLVPVVAKVGEALGLEARQVLSTGDGPLGLRARWLLLSRHAEVLGTPGLAGASQRATGFSAAPLWTDDSTSVWQAVRW